MKKKSLRSSFENMIESIVEKQLLLLLLSLLIIFNNISLIRHNEPF